MLVSRRNGLDVMMGQEKSSGRQMSDLVKLELHNEKETQRLGGLRCGETSYLYIG